MRTTSVSVLVCVTVAAAGVLCPGRTGEAGIVSASAEERATLVARTQGLAAEILPKVAALNGFPGYRPVRIEAWTKAELRDTATASLRELYGADGLQRAGRVMAALGLLPPDYDLEAGLPALLIELMGGGYDPQRKVFYVLADAPASQQGEAVERMVTAHELTHALQDQRDDVFAQQQQGVGDWDYDHVYNAVIEGMAYVTMMAILQGVSLPEAPDATELLRATRQQLEASPAYPVLAASPRFARELIFGVAIRGTSFCRALLRDHPEFMLATLLDSLPASGEQVLHYEKFVEGDRPAQISLSAIDGALPPDWRPYLANTLGEFDILILCESHDATESTAAAVAAGWDGCRFRAFELGTGELAILGVSAWDTEEDAREFREAFGLIHAEDVNAPRLVMEQAGVVVRFVLGPPGEEIGHLGLAALAAVETSN